MRCDFHLTRLISISVVATTLVAIPLLSHAVDTDLDGVDDSIDNCTTIANASQNDSNADGFGNRCDPDFDQNCTVNSSDESPLPSPIRWFESRFRSG